MGLIKPDAFYQACRNKKATFECLKAFRRFYPESYVYLVSDGGDDLSDVARLFCCEYQYLDPLGHGAKTVQQRAEWLRRFAYAARRATSNHMLLLEDDVLIRGQIRRSEQFALAGPHNGYERLSPQLFHHLRRRFPHLTSDCYGGCGGSLAHRGTLLECAERLDFNDPALTGALDKRAVHTDVFFTLIFLAQGHPYLSLEDVYCEATFVYPDWRTNNRPIVHQYKRFYGRQLDAGDLRLLGAQERGRLDSGAAASPEISAEAR
jgi:hypothetical protein